MVGSKGMPNFKPSVTSGAKPLIQNSMNRPASKDIRGGGVASQASKHEE